MQQPTHQHNLVWRRDRAIEAQKNAVTIHEWLIQQDIIDDLDKQIKSQFIMETIDLRIGA